MQQYYLLIRVGKTFAYVLFSHFFLTILHRFCLHEGYLACQTAGKNVEHMNVTSTNLISVAKAGSGGEQRGGRQEKTRQASKS